MLPHTAAQFFLQALTVALLLLLIVVYFTRPGRRRLIGAVTGGLVFLVLNIAWDIAAYSAGWWHTHLQQIPMLRFGFTSHRIHCMASGQP